MNKKKIVLLLLLMIFTHQNVLAASSCSYKEQADLNAEAAQIKVKYEEKVGQLDPSQYDCDSPDEECTVDYYYLGLTILNMSENFYIEAKNDTGFRKTFTYNDVKDGIITFDHKDVMEIGNFTFDVYSSSKTNCANERYRVIHFTTPKFNRYYYNGECDGIEDYYLCQKYVTSDTPDYDGFLKQVTNYKKDINNNKSEDTRNILEKLFDFIDDHKALIGVTTAVVVAGVATVVIVKKRKETI